MFTSMEDCSAGNGMEAFRLVLIMINSLFMEWYLSTRKRGVGSSSPASRRSNIHAVDAETEAQNKH